MRDETGVEHPATSPRLRRIEAAVALAVFMLFVAYFGLLCFRFEWQGDIQRHAAAVASLYLDFFHPPHEAVATPGYTSDVHTPYIVAVAALGRLLHVTPYRALQLAGVLNLLLYGWATWFFFRTFSLVPESWLPPLLFLVVTLCMRQSVHWWASETSFQTLRAIQAYPSLFAWGIAITMIALAQRLAQQSNRRLLLLAALVWALMLSHSITGTWAVGIVGVIGIVELMKCKGAQAARRRVLLLYTATAVGLALTYFWPYFDITRQVHLLTVEEVSELADRPFRDMAPLYVLAAITGVWFLRRREHPVFVAGFVATWLAWLAWRFLGYPHGNRYIFFQAFFAQAAVADMTAIGLLQLLERGAPVPDAHLPRAGLRWFWPAFALSSIALSLTSPIMRASAPGFGAILAAPSAHDAYYQRLGSLPDRVNRHDIVLMPYSYLAWDVASITGARVVIAPYAFHLPDYARRLDDVARFFARETPSSVRVEILQRYKISKVLLPAGDTEVARELGPHESVLIAGKPWLLVDLPTPGPRRTTS